MDIGTFSMNLAQDRLSSEVGTRLLSMALKGMEGQGASLEKLLTGSKETIVDPSLGSRLDINA
jgi:hypothetical protein